MAELCPECKTFVERAKDGLLRPHHLYQQGKPVRWCVAPRKSKERA